MIFSCYVFTDLILYVTSGPFGGGDFELYRITNLILFKTSGPSGGHIFLIVKKDMEERHAKGLQSRPLETGFDTGE